MTDLKAEVGVSVHAREEVRVRALLEKPPLAGKFGGDGLIGLME
jgi:hypothetical protein